MSAIRPHQKLLALLILISSFQLAASPQDEFSQWLTQRDAEFADYLSAQDAEFSAYLKNNWQEFTQFKAKVRDPEPKPKQAPIAKPAEPTAKPTAPKAPVVKPLSKKIIQPEPEFIPANPITAQKQFKIDLFGLALFFPEVDNPIPQLVTQVDNLVISDFWETWAAEKPDLVNALQNLKTHYHFNDWDYVLLSKKISEFYYPKQDNAQVLMHWFLLNKLGFKAKVGLVQNHSVLLLPTQETIFERAYITENQQAFYVFYAPASDETQSIKTYPGEPPFNNRRISLKLNYSLPSEHPNHISQEKITREFILQPNQKKQPIQITLEKNQLDYYQTYPQTELALYFSANYQSDALQQLRHALQPQLNDLSETAAVNALLHFVQNGLAYQTDYEQFGSEDYLFPEESLFFPYADCEDRSILFAYLVENLLGLDVIGLYYPGHVATAVALKQDTLEGDSIHYQNKQFLIADPTYINANLGMSMPQYREESAEVLIP